MFFFFAVPYFDNKWFSLNGTRVLLQRNLMIMFDGTPAFFDLRSIIYEFYAKINLLSSVWQIKLILRQEKNSSIIIILQFQTLLFVIETSFIETCFVPVFIVVIIICIYARYFFLLLIQNAFFIFSSHIYSIGIGKPVLLIMIIIITQQHTCSL